MTNILDRVAAERSSFRPETTREFLALQLARKLNDVASVRSYVVLFDTYPEEFLLSVYRSILDKGRNEWMAENFRLELRRRLKEQNI